MKLPRLVIRLLVLGLLPIHFLHCADPLRAGVVAFHAASYPGAVRELEQIDPLSLRSAQRTRWQLYRGLSALALGDLDVALSCLDATRNAVSSAPTLLNIDERVQLDAAWDSIGLMPGESAGLSSTPAAIPRQRNPHSNCSAKPPPYGAASHTTTP